MASSINGFRFITLLCLVFLVFLTESASANKLNYVLKFNNDNLDDLSFTVLTDEDTVLTDDVEAPAYSFIAFTDDDSSFQTQSITLAPDQVLSALFVRPVKNKETFQVISFWKQGQNETLHSIVHTSKDIDSLSTLININSERQTAPSESPTEQHWERLLITNLPYICLTGSHGLALGFDNVTFSPFIDSVSYVASSEGNGYYRGRFSAVAFNTPLPTAINASPRSNIIIDAEIHLNNAGVPVRVSFEYNSVQFELSLQESGTPPAQPAAAANDEEGYETQEVEITLSDEEDTRGLTRFPSEEQLHPGFPFPPHASGSF